MSNTNGIRFRFFVQQLVYNASIGSTGSYTLGSFVDTFASFGIACKECPFVLFPESKDVLTEDWPDSHGADVYIPNHAKLKDYDFEATFIASGSDNTIQANIKSFAQFLYGLNTNGSSRLAILDEHSGIGRKDVRVESLGNDLWWNEDCDDEKIAIFKVKFHVYDPVTEVTLSSGGNSLEW